MFSRATLLLFPRQLPSIAPAFRAARLPRQDAQSVLCLLSRGIQTNAKPLTHSLFVACRNRVVPKVITKPFGIVRALSTTKPILAKINSSIHDGIATAKAAGIKRPCKKIPRNEDAEQIREEVLKEIKIATEKLNAARKLTRKSDPSDYTLKQQCFVIIEMENRHMPAINQVIETSQSILNDAMHLSNMNGLRPGCNDIDPRTGGPSDRDLVPINRVLECRVRLSTMEGSLKSLEKTVRTALTKRAAQGTLEPWGEFMLRAMVDETGSRWNREWGYKAREILERTDF